MFSFFYRSHRIILSGLASCVILSMFFFGVGNNDIPQATEIKDVSYEIGKGEHKRSIKKKEIEAMKTFLSYDLGYGFNDVLPRQNLFADGFFLELLHSPFGKGLVEKFFPLVKDDFAKRVAIHKRFRFYKHPSGEFHLEDKLKERAGPFYDLYQIVTKKDREVDESLLKDYIEIAHMQKIATPAFIHSIVVSVLQSGRLAFDESVDRRNYALFYSKNNEEMFGSAFLELSAQVIIEYAEYAKNNGYNTSYEEAKGVIMRRSIAEITDKYTDISDPIKIQEIHDRYQANLGINERDLVYTAQKILNFQRMLKDIDASVLLDNLTISDIFSDRVENILVTLVQDSDNLKVRNASDALELQCYLESIGEVSDFLSVPEKIYEENKRREIAPSLFIKNYVLKIAGIKKSSVSGATPLKKIWEFQTSDKGWVLLQKKFSLEEKEEGERFSYLQNFEEDQKNEMKNYSIKQLVDTDDAFLRAALEKETLTKGSFFFNERSNTNSLYAGFDENALEVLLNEKQEGEEISFYSQDGEHYFRVYIIEKPEMRVMADFYTAKTRGYLKLLVDDKLVKLHKGRKVSDASRQTLCEKLLKKEAGNETCKKILAAEKEKKIYCDHMIKRLKSYDLLEEKKASDLLAQFSVSKKNEVIVKSGNNYRLARDEFFTINNGEVSSMQFEENGSPYFVQVNGFKIDAEKTEMLKERVSKQIAKEARQKLYHELLSHIENNKMIEMSRFEKEKAL